MIRVGCFDTRFYGFQDVLNEQDIEKLELSGAGGIQAPDADHSVAHGKHLPHLFCLGAKIGLPQFFEQHF